jgi:lysylphosphatidylglycerol synthetase-like protein (DUF2156 family)
VKVVAFLAKAPLTVGFVLALWLLGAITGSLLSGPPDAVLDQVGIGVPSVAEGRMWTVFSSALWCLNLGGYLGTTVLLLVFGIAAEREFGAARTVLLFLTSQAFGTLAGVCLVKLGSLAGWAWLFDLDGDLTVSPSTGAVGLGMALTCRLSALWRRRVRLLVIISLLVLALYSGYLQDVLRLAGGIVGLLLGTAVLRRNFRPTLSAPSNSETRVLVALLLAASALGPVVAMISPFPNGPLSWFTDVITVPRPTQDLIDAVCADPSSAADCRTLLAENSYGLLPALFMAVVPALLLLVLAEGLRRGRRFAWSAALVLNLAMVGLFSWYVVELATLPAGEPGEPPISTPQVLVEFGFPLLLPVALSVVLLATRRHFPLTVPRSGLRRFWVFVTGALVALSAVYLGVGYLARDQFTPEPTFGDLLADLPARFLPPGYLGLLPLRFSADDFLSTLLFEYTGVVFWALVLAGLLVASWRAKPHPDANAAAKAHELMVRHGGSSLSYMTTWRGNHYWFTDDDRAAVAYRVVSTIALTVGDPIGAPDARRAAVRGFAEFCVHNGWMPCFYSISEEMRDAATDDGWDAVQVAEDTVVPLAELSFTGKKWQDVRTALNKAEKAGITAEWWRYPDAPLGLKDQVRSISEEWVADKGLPEMGFTLGGLEELADNEVRCLIAIDADRTVHGITSWLPVHEDGEIVGWTLDFMRRRANGFRGSMEFLIASAALTLKEEGATFLSLSGAPLARLDRGEQPGGLQRLLDFTGQVLEPVYGFRSLFAFKAKFQPVYRPMFMAYPDSAALPRIANAVSRAYLPDMSARQGLRLVGKVLKR